MRLTISLIIAIVIVSYTEALQKNIFMPLRNWIVNSDSKLDKLNNESLPKGMSYKASKDGYYVNFWQASLEISPVAEKVLAKNCDVLSQNSRKQLESFAKYFIQVAEIRTNNKNKFAVWPYPIKFNYGLKPGWISSMVQANVAVVLAAASKCVTENDSNVFKKYADLAIRSFHVPVEGGGVKVKVEGGYWYEEYAQVGVKPPKVLNGHNYAVFALRQLITFNDTAEDLYNHGVNAVVNNIHKYDAVTWSFYDLAGNPANSYYQPLHSRQMARYFNLTGLDVFSKYEKKFSKQLFSPFSSVQRLYLLPSRFLFILLILNTLIVFISITIIRYLKQRKPI